MNGDIVDQGVELMLFGMGTVVIFLTLLIIATNLMSWFLRRYLPESEVPAMSIGRSPAQQPQSVDQTRLVAVVTAAIHRHRANKK
jgi:oxaloacetate decarboxylase gamma subunit